MNNRAEDLLVYTAGLPWLLRNDREESLVMMELLLLLLRDGLILQSRLPQPLYNEDLRDRLGLCFADWSEKKIRQAMELTKIAGGASIPLWSAGWL